MAKVSIIIPVYNVEEYIEKALDSACNQTLEDIEIICIDDCSTDKSVEIIKRYAERDSRIKLLKTEINQGQGNARNLGLKHVNAEYIMFLDPDDWFALNACELAYNQIKTNDNDVVNFNYYIFYEKNNKYKFRNGVKAFKNVKNKNQIDLNELENFKIPGGSVWDHIYKTDFIKQNNIEFGYGHCGEDNIFFLKSMLLAKTISIIKEPLYYYRKRHNKTSCTDTDMYCFEGIDAKAECYNIVKKYISNNKFNIGVIYCLNSVIHIFEANNKKIKNIKIKIKFYNEIKKLLSLIAIECNIDKSIKAKIKNRDIFRIIKYNFYLYFFFKTIDHFFSIYIEEEKLKIKILGLRFTFKA